MRIALALPGIDADQVELELLRAGHRIAWRAIDREELLRQLAEDAPDVVLVADDPAVATLDVVGAGDLLGVRTCLVRADDAASASARLLGVHDVLRAVPGRPVDLSVLRAPFDALDGGIDEAAAPRLRDAPGGPPAGSEPSGAATPGPWPLGPSAGGDDPAPSDPGAAPARRRAGRDPAAAARGDAASAGGGRAPGIRRPWGRSPRRRGGAATPPTSTESTPAPAPSAAPAASVDPRRPGRAAEPPPSEPATEPAPSTPAHRVIAVWGPAGAPGRTLIATTLAAELAARGLHVCLVDADTYGGTIAPSLGLLDEAPGFAAACRLAASDALDAGQLDRVSVDYGGSTAPFRVLTGIGRPHRWPELARDRVIGALEQARQWCDVVVVDVGFNLETDEELSSDLLSPRRNAATIAALRTADEVVAVGAADPVGITRLLRTHADLLETVTVEAVHVVVNRVRSSVLGVDPAGQVRQTLDRFGGIPNPLLIPDDAAAADAALLGARTVVDAAPRSPLRQGVAALADRLGYGAAAAPRRSAWGRMRRTG
ncbi:AAA family ATPase [Microcella flavibacter]|uniref:AAA family ATPase n=1 Tax=Microcella flavibacter TaxID=1804990 RepID=UPI00145742B1|nr:septum formation inhibitor-activating ATPase [Microcella flavibacter]